MKFFKNKWIFDPKPMTLRTLRNLIIWIWFPYHICCTLAWGYIEKPSKENSPKRMVSMESDVSRPPSEENPFDETMLMFVGEELSVVTVASKRPESPSAAPAIAQVVNRSKIEDRGFKTLAELLAQETSFFMAGREPGTEPYLRGIPNGILFLQDGVPMTFDATKNLHPLDRELPLDSVKQVEIVRGPGSVLWGPDAFAGVVNVVPFSGRDRPGVETKVFFGSEELKGAYIGWGHAAKHWDGFLSAYAATDKYHEETFLVTKPIGSPGEDPLGEETIDSSDYLEFRGNAHYGDWLSVSGRYSDFSRKYTLKDTGSLSWAGERESPINYLKATMSKAIGPSHWSLTGYYQNVKYAITDVDLVREQENDLYHVELLWDRRIWEKGLLTAGASYRENHVDGAIISDNFLPGFIKPPNMIFVPTIVQKDYNNDLKSFFAQFRHQWQDINWWLGGRVDDHSQYQTTFTYSFGFNWAFRDDWQLKFVYGNAYRSPYSSQLFGGQDFDPEEISTLNLQIAWNPRPHHSLAVTTFYSKLRDHIQEDPYGGLSLPSNPEIIGLEFEAKARFFSTLDVFGNLMVLNSWGGEERYRVFKYAFIRPDGSREFFFDTWEQPYDPGPSYLLKAGFIWRFHPNAFFALDGTLNDDVPFNFDKGKVSGDFDQPLLLGATLNLKDFLIQNSTLTLRGRNLRNKDYQVPGVFGPAEGSPFLFSIEWAYRF